MSLFRSTLIHFQIRFSQLFLQFLLCNAHIIQALGQKIQMLQRITPTLFFDLVSSSHLFKEDLGLGQRLWLFGRCCCVKLEAEAGRTQDAATGSAMPPLLCATHNTQLLELRLDRGILLQRRRKRRSATQIDG